MRVLAAIAAIAVGCSSPSAPKREPTGPASPAQPTPDVAQPAPVATPALPAPAPALPVPVPAFDAPAPADRITSIASGSRTTCVVRASGHVDCWGSFYDADYRVRRLPVTDAIAVGVESPEALGVICVLGKRGVACATPASRTFEPVGTLAGPIALAAADPRCALTKQRGIACWGPGNPVTATAIPRIRDAVAIAHAAGYVCAIRASGALECGGTEGSPLAPLAGLGRVRSIAFGDAHPGDDTGGIAPREVDACAVLQTGEVRCFVLSAQKRSIRIVSPAFDAHPGDRMGRSELTLTDEAAQALRGATALALGDRDGVAGLVGGRVVVSDGEQTRTLPRLDDAVAITPRCALRAQGSVVCWGKNEGGALGQPTTVTRMIDRPVTVVGLAAVADLAVADGAAYARTRDGRLYRWGGGQSGWPVPIASVGAGGALVQATGREQPLCIARDRELRCLDRDGRLAATGIAKVAAVRAGDERLTALFEDGTVAQWDPRAGKPPRRIPGLAGAVEVAGDSLLTCARTASGDVRCTASCTITPDEPCWKPARDPGIRDAAELAVITGTACVRRRTGAVVCWGRNSLGQAGTGPGSTVTEPTPIPGIGDAIGLAIAPGQTCAIRAGGKLTCWGSFSFPGHISPRAPHDVLEAGVAAVRLHLGFGCAVLTNGHAACWGGNSAGELGDGSILELTEPAAVPGL